MAITNSWSNEILNLWGKTDSRNGTFMPVVYHMEDSSAVAEYLWDSWLSPNVKEMLLDIDPQARDAFCFLTAIHDIGKITPHKPHVSGDEPY